MNIDAIKARIEGNIGREISFYEKTGSTNTLAMQLAEGMSEGAVIISDSQEKGRGRLGRSWVSPPGVNIYMSIMLRPRIGPGDATLLTIMTAVACTKALRRATGLHISIKWPNDLIVYDRKLGGILTELKIARRRIVCAVIGIGINVNIDTKDFPREIRKIATSIKNESGKAFAREVLVAEILNEMNGWYAVLNALQRQALISEWQRLTSTLGKRVMVIAGEDTYTGLAETIDNEGMLILRLASGERKRISSGDLTVMR